MFILLFSICSGDKYYRFDENRYEVMRGYPREINKFFACEDDNRKKVIRQVNLRKEQLRGSNTENHSYQLNSSKLFYSFFTLFTTIFLIYEKY